MSKAFKQRTRASTFAAFVRRYGPIDAPDDGNMCRPWDDKDILAAFDRGREAGHRFVWTIVIGDERMYVVPGFATVNYLGRILCERPWPDDEERQPGYVW